MLKTPYFVQFAWQNFDFRGNFRCPETCPSDGKRGKRRELSQQFKQLAQLLCLSARL